jgi:hypothetical protein
MYIGWSTYHFLCKTLPALHLSDVVLFVLFCFVFPGGAVHGIKADPKFVLFDVNYKHALLFDVYLMTYRRTGSSPRVLPEKDKSAHQRRSFDWAKTPLSVSANRTLRCVQLFCLTGIRMFVIIIYVFVMINMLMPAPMIV